MSAISGNFGSGCNPSQMMQGMGDILKNSDTDGNEAVSKTEFVNAMEESGLDTSKMDKMFDRMDANNDGEISNQEQQDMMTTMENRMGSLGSGSQEDFDSVKTLLESLESSTEDVDEKQRLQDALEKMHAEGYSNSTMSDSLSLINNVIPGVNTSA